MPRKRNIFLPVKCSGCTSGGCESNTFCDPWQDKINHDYGDTSMRHTADGFDCALPLCIDTYNACSFNCLYCFSNFLMRDPNRKGTFIVKSINPDRVERFLKYEDVRIRASFLNRSLLDMGRTQCPIQWGALGDPFDCIERHHGIGLQLIDMFCKYEQPVRVSTKGGNLLLNSKYLKALDKNPKLFWFAFSLITVDEEKLALIDKDAPTAHERLSAMKVLTDNGMKASLRMRPIFPGVSDSTRKHPHAWRDLLRRSADAGASSVSIEFVFVPGVMPPYVKKMWDKINDIVGFDIVNWYKRTSAGGVCLRSSASWKEDMVWAIYEEAKKLGLHFGISDPHWKELNDFGCCCGIPGDDPVFGGWMRQNATNVLLKAKRGHLVSAEDGIPDWAYDLPMQDLISMSGAAKAYNRATEKWSDKLRRNWNSLSTPRGVMNYFEGVLRPIDRMDNGDVVYKYKKRKRKYLNNKHFTL